MKIKLSDLYCNLVLAIKRQPTMNIPFSTSCRRIYMGECIFVECRVIDTPHYLYITGENKTEYEYYMKNAGHYAGYGLEHSQEIFDKLIETFEYKDEPKIVCNNSQRNKYVIIDGLHRAALMVAKFGDDHEVDVLVM